LHKTIVKIRVCTLVAIASCIGILSITSDSFSQGRDRSKFQMSIDTTGTRYDTSKSIDTSLVKEPLDSTARIQYFKYVRQDKPNPSFGTYESSFFLYTSHVIERTITFDSLNNVTITESFNGQQIKYPLKIPLDKYINIKEDQTIRNQFYAIAADFYKIESKDELEKLFKNITDITIPLPFTTETIFGPPTISLKINGAIDITASYQKSSSDQQTITDVSQTQNNINFKQEVQVTTKGSIGDKLTIDADWNSQRTFDYENQLKLKYTGYPDEVIQSLEAGNVSLETKSNLIGSTQALFGVKGQFKLGPMTLTAIASQKKSEKKEVDITGGSQQINFEIPAYQYDDNNYFLDTAYRSSFEEYYYYGQLITQSLIEQRVAPDIEVWVQTTINNPNRRKAVCWIELPEKGPGYSPHYRSQDTGQIDGQKFTGYFYKLNASDFTLHDLAGYITLNISLPPAPNDAVAVAYRYSNHPTTQFGYFSGDVPPDSLVLKLVRFPGLLPPTQDTAQRTAWNLKIKNIYSVGVRNIRNDPTKFSFSVYYKPPSGDKQENLILNNSSISYLKLLDLDLRTNGQNYDPRYSKDDGAFDFFSGYTIDLAAGAVIFPTLSPFYKTLKEKGVFDSLIHVDTTIYSNSKTDAQYSTIKFYMGGTAIGDASSRYSLGFNVVEGSVKVFNGSVQLIQGVDYTIDYSTGELVIQNAGVLSAGSNLKIQYESNDLFQLASKTLLGARLEYAFNKTSYAGFTLLNLKQQTLNDKVRIGEEPTNNTILGFDASTDIKTGFLTRLINKIPGYNTKEESDLNLKGEVALMLPDPNTKKSIIPGDNGESVAYIDDFEGAKKIIDFGLNPLAWTVSSIPKDSSIIRNGSDTATWQMSIRRCHFEWFNLVNNVPVTEVYPNRQVGSSSNNTLTPLALNIRPYIPGMYSYIDSNSFVTLDGTDSRKKWTGIFKYLNTSQTNLLDENMGFIEIWMKIDTIAPGDSAKMLIDLGLVTEKIIADQRVPFPGYNRNFHTEDANNNGLLESNEDNGIDGIPDAVEQQLFPGLGSDPSRDDYSWNQNSTNFYGFNGTEGNATLNKRIDAEDLNGNGVLDEINNYWEYEMPLDTNISRNKYITGGGNKGWYQYRIPLSDVYRNYGSATTLTNVQYVRVWFKGFTKDASMRIVELSLVGNQWQKTNKSDTAYSISVVNIEENQNIYMSPVGGNVLRQTDPSSLDPNVLQNEQSMSVDVRKLYQGQAKFATKFFNTKPIDLLNYKILKLFVNGDPSFRYVDTGNYDAAMVIRLGSDSANYYEYRAPLHPDQRPGQPWNTLNEVSINLSDITQVKQVRDSIVTIPVYIPVPNGPPGSKYGVLGSPTIGNITQISLGVINNHNSSIPYPLTGSVWFNEMRVLKTNDKSGYAYNISAALKIADFGNLNFSYSKVDPNFHSLEDRFGSRINSNSWDFSGTLNLHKILNSLLSSWLSIKFKDFFTIPITFEHSESYQKPLFLPNTDIDMETAAQNKYRTVLAQNPNDPSYAQYASDQVRIASQTLIVTNRFAVNGMKFTLPGDNFFVQEMLNKLEISFYKNSTTERSPESQSIYQWDMGGTIGMTSNLKLLDKLNLSIGKLLPLGDDYKNAKLYFFFPFFPLMPLFSNNLAIGANFTRNHGDQTLRGQFQPNPTTRNFAINRNFSLEWKFIENWIVDLTGNYAFNAGSDLTYLETTSDSLRLQRNNSQILRDIFFHNALINFGRDLSYSQTINITPKFNIPVFKNFVDITTSYRSQYGWAPSLSSANLGSSVGFTSDFQASSYIKLKQFFDLLKGSDQPNKFEGGSSPMFQNQQQSLADVLKLLRTFVPDQFSLTFSQSHTVADGGVNGRPGFANFWTYWNTKENYGPSRSFQLGWTNYPGTRVPNLQLQDQEGLTNSINLSTFINPIFPNNLKINFTYKQSWATNNQLGYVTDSLGNLGLPTSIYNVRTLTRPSFIFGTNIVNNLAKPAPQDPNISAEIADSFEKSVVSFPFPSWTITLNGLEKFEMFQNFASSISLENSYSCDYKKVLQYNASQPEFVSSQSLTSGFSPLIGINVGFKQIQGGNLTASFKLNKTNNYDLTPSSLLINITNTTDLAINASYTKSGFKIPLFGLTLDNDVSISFSYTRTNNDPRTLNLVDQQWNDAAQTSGSISTSLNPSIQYALTKNVSIQLFYKYTKIQPTQGSLQIPTTTSNEAGLDLKLTIQ